MTTRYYFTAGHGRNSTRHILPDSESVRSICGHATVKKNLDGTPNKQHITPLSHGGIPKDKLCNHCRKEAEKRCIPIEDAVVDSQVTAL